MLKRGAFIRYIIYNQNTLSTLQTPGITRDSLINIMATDTNIALFVHFITGQSDAVHMTYVEVVRDDGCWY